MAEVNQLTKSECLELLSRYRNWNSAQTSISLAFGGPRTQEDDLLDARREMLIAVTERLTELSNG